RLDAEHGVLDHAQRPGARAVLLDDPDARGTRRPAIPARDVDRLAGDLERPAVAAHHAGDDLDQRRLAGAVLADQLVPRAAPHRQLRARQHLARAVPLVELRADHHGLGHCHGTWILPATICSPSALAFSTTSIGSISRLRSSDTKPTPCSA